MQQLESRHKSDLKKHFSAQEKELEQLQVKFEKELERLRFKLRTKLNEKVYVRASAMS